MGLSIGHAAATLAGAGFQSGLHAFKSLPMSDPHWPRFWSDVPEDDRPALREILAELIGRGTLLGSSGAGRDYFLLARDHYQEHLKDYLAPLGLELIIDDDFFILQARPRPEACHLLAQFTKDETLLLLVLWRVWDIQATPTGKGEGAAISLNRNAKKQSGGENQAPFFVAMLAAFQRVYDLGPRESRRNLGNRHLMVESPEGVAIQNRSISRTSTTQGSART